MRQCTHKDQRPGYAKFPSSLVLQWGGGKLLLAPCCMCLFGASFLKPAPPTPAIFTSHNDHLQTSRKIGKTAVIQRINTAFEFATSPFVSRIRGLNTRHRKCWSDDAKGFLKKVKPAVCGTTSGRFPTFEKTIAGH